MELKPCPFCGAGETISDADSKHWTGMQYNILSWHVRHWCAYEHHGPMLNVKGRTQEETEARWNTRAPTPDRKGEKNWATTVAQRDERIAQLESDLSAAETDLSAAEVLMLNERKRLYLRVAALEAAMWKFIHECEQDNASVIATEYEFRKLLIPDIGSPSRPDNVSTGSALSDAGEHVQ